MMKIILSFLMICLGQFYYSQNFNFDYLVDYKVKFFGGETKSYKFYKSTKEKYLLSINKKNAKLYDYDNNLIHKFSIKNNNFIYLESYKSDFSQVEFSINKVNVNTIDSSNFLIICDRHNKIELPQLIIEVHINKTNEDLHKLIFLDLNPKLQDQITNEFMKKIDEKNFIIDNYTVSYSGYDMKSNYKIKKIEKKDLNLLLPINLVFVDNSQNF